MDKNMSGHKDTYSPVPHTLDDDEKMLANPEFKKAWNALEGKYAALSKLLRTNKQTKGN
jgi:hypothetical protein